MGFLSPEYLQTVLLIQYPCLLFSLCVHEAAHAAMANRCGDPSAKLLGRLTLNPKAHIDPIGTVALPLIMMVFQVPFLFGWAKPVPFNPVNLKNIRRDPVLIAMAGPASNILILIMTVLIIRTTLVIVDGGLIGFEAAWPIIKLFWYLASINLVLALFNLIPVPPLDGHYLLGLVLSPDQMRVVQQFAPMGIFVAILVANSVLGPVLGFLGEFVQRAMGLMGG